MPWFKVDDQLATHPKVVRAGLAAMGLWVRAGSWSAQHLTNGHIPTELVPMLGAKRVHADALVKAGLWVEDMDGWRFHDWADHQPSAADTRALKDERTKAGQYGNHRRWHVRRGRKVDDCPFCEGT